MALIEPLRYPSAVFDWYPLFPFHHAGLLDAGEFEVETLKLVGEALVVDAELVEHGGVEVVDGDGGTASPIRDGGQL